jgi:two-component sensor histidine kinase
MPLAFEVEVPARASEVAGVRREIRAALERYGLDRTHADTAQLLASELLVNAVIHGSPPIVVRMSVETDTTVLEVYDGGDALPATDSVGEDGSARGLQVVAALCADWGVVPAENGGKTVWCTIPHHEPGSAAETPRRRAADAPPSLT